jgi:diguanylate cyclase (GGDEF)-like protein/PAS domain S-box-containing protein
MIPLPVHKRSAKALILRCVYGLAFLFLLCIISACGAAAITVKKPSITTIKVVMDNNYPPYVFQDDQGNLQGILIDQWRLWEKRTGVKVEITALDWGQALGRMKAGEFDVIDTIFYTDERAKYFDFTKPYAQINVSIFFQKNISGIANVGNLKGFRVAVKKGDANADYLLKQGINSLVYYDSYQAIVQAAAKNEETIFVIDQPPGLYFLYKYAIQDQFKFSEPLYGGEFHRAVRKGNAQIISLVEDGFSLITPVEYQVIDDRWFGSRRVQDLTQYLPYLGLAVIFALVIIFSLFVFNRMLQGRVQKRTFELRDAIANLQRSETRFRDAIEFFPVPISIVDITGAILSVNRKFTEYYGYSLSDIPSVSEWILQSYADLHYRQEVLARWNDDIANASRNGTNTLLREYKVTCKDGTQRDVEIVMHPIGDLWVASFNDVTERKLMDAALRESELKYRGVFEFGSDALLLINENVIIDCNPRSLQIFGCQRNEFIGQSLYRFSPPIQRDGRGSQENWIEKMTSALAGATQSFEWVQTRLDGSPFDADVSINRIILDGSVFIQATIRDITARKRAEKVQNVVYRISQAAIASDSIDELYRSIHTILGELIPVENFYIALYDPVTELIHFPYYVDQYDQQPVPAKPACGLTEYVLRKGRPVLLWHENFTELIQSGEVKLVGTEPYNWLGSPLKVVVQSYSEEYQFQQETLDLLEFVSSQVALTIERKRAEDDLRSLSITDDLTGIYNRRGFILLAEQQVKQAHRMKRCMYLVFTDMDGLKNINDTFGHPEGDLALIELAGVLAETFREADILSRYGGDEFVILALDASGDDASALIARLQQVLDAHNARPGRRYKLSISIGVTRYDPEVPCSVNDLIIQADRLMYQHKQTRSGHKS